MTSNEADRDLSEFAALMKRAPSHQEDNSTVLQNDLRDMLRALGLPDYAQPHSPHIVFRECIDEVKRLKSAAPSHQAGQEGIVGRLNAHIDASTKPDWRELAEASDRIETLEEALRPFAKIADFFLPENMDHLSMGLSLTLGDFRKARAALADGGG